METLPYATTWMNLENIMLSKANKPVTKGKYYIIPLI